MQIPQVTSDGQKKCTNKAIITKYFNLSRIHLGDFGICLCVSTWLQIGSSSFIQTPWNPQVFKVLI